MRINGLRESDIVVKVEAGTGYGKTTIARFIAHELAAAGFQHVVVEDVNNASKSPQYGYAEGMKALIQTGACHAQSRVVIVTEGRKSK